MAATTGTALSAISQPDVFGTCSPLRVSVDPRSRDRTRPPLRGGQTGSLGVSPRHEGFTRFLRALVLRRVLVDADEAHNSGIGRIGEVRHAM